MAQEFSSRLIHRGLYNGFEYVGLVMKSGTGNYIADIHDEPQRSDPIYGTFSDFEAAEQFVREQWEKKFQQMEQLHAIVQVQPGTTGTMVKARMNMRLELLQSIYRAHFEEGKQSLTIDFASEQAETFVAYQYLSDKGFIRMECVHNDEYRVRVTANGIDIVELELPLR